MKVERPRARLSDAPTRLNSRSTSPSVAARRGHEAAGLREHDDQRVLAQEGRLAAHVRAGDQPQPRSFGESAQSLATKRSPACAQRRLDHRMAAALDLETGVVDERRAAHQPPSAARSASAGGDVEPGERVGGGGDRLARGERASPISSSRCAASAASAWRAGLRRPAARLLVQLGRVEAHRRRPASGGG